MYLDTTWYHWKTGCFPVFINLSKFTAMYIFAETEPQMWTGRITP